MSSLLTSARCAFWIGLRLFVRRRTGAATGSEQEAMDGFARVNAGVTSPAEFFSEQNVRRLCAAAG